MTFYFNRKYLTLALLLFAVEIYIAMFVNDQFVRPFVGDVLAVWLVYAVASIFIKADARKIAGGAFVFACAVEILQYFDYVKLLGLENNRALSVLLGRTFELFDFVAYFIGFLTILLIEKISRRRNL